MRVFALIFLALPLAAQTNLTVKTATSKRVDLTWTGTASSYTVQRAVLGASFATIGTSTTPSYSDTTIDPYTTYRYQIVAGSTSNPVTVGPPPAGFSVAAAPPGSAASGIVSDYGYDLQMVLDGNGDPAFAFVFYDPNQDTDGADTQVMFRSWNRALYKWNDVVKVAAVGDIATYFRQTISLAYDSSTGTWGIASERNQGDIVLYTSTDGVAWTLKQTFTSNSRLTGPSLALSGGKIHFAYVDDAGGLRYVTGVLSSASSSWTGKFAPVPPGTETARDNVTPSLALDSGGVPAIAYWVDDDTRSYNLILYFWRPAGTAAPVKVTDTEGNQSDEIAVQLLFAGTQPRIFFYAQRSDADFGVGDHFVRSDDGGATWKTPVVIPPDGNSSTDYPFSGALDSHGDVAFAFGRNSGSGDSVCGNPKLSKSTDLVHFTTCAAADVSVTGDFESYPSSIALAYGGNDKLYLMWWQESDSSTGTGLLMWREPPAGTGTAPVINTDGTGVMNGATNIANSPIVAGSWVTIKGANFSDASLNWNNLDFSNGLPTTIGGVQVLFNGKPAATYYIQNDQINVQAPSSVPSSGNVSVQVVRNNVTSNTVSATAAAAAPGIFPYSLDNGKTFYPAAVFLDSTLVGDPAVLASARKAKPGDVVLLFTTGMGVSPAGVLVDPTGFAPAVQVLIDNTPATVTSTFLVAPGEWQINIVVPSGLSDGNHQIVVKTGGASSQAGVIIPITH